MKHKALLTLIAISDAFVAIAAGDVVEYGYDAAGNRVSRLVAAAVQQVPAQPQDTLFTVYPTVVSDAITITAKKEIAANEYSYTIASMSGNVVKNGVITSQTTLLPLSIPQGHYILNIHSATAQYSFNFLKN